MLLISTVYNCRYELETTHIKGFIWLLSLSGGLFSTIYLMTHGFIGYFDKSKNFYTQIIAFCGIYTVILCFNLCFRYDIM